MSLISDQMVANFWPYNTIGDWWPTFWLRNTNKTKQSDKCRSIFCCRISPHGARLTNWIDEDQKLSHQHVFSCSMQDARRMNVDAQQDSIVTRLLNVLHTPHTMPGDLSTSMWVIRDNSTFPQYYSHVWWRIGVSRKLSPGNFCTIAKISGEFAKALKMKFFGLKTIYIFIIHTKE